MAIIKNKRIKKYVCVILSMLTFFGYFGFFYTALNAKPRNVGYFEKQQPLHGINDIVIDRKGHIYYGNGLHSSIQVYDNEGRFLYGFSFRSSKEFPFYMDEQDYIHVAADSLLTFYNGILLETKEYKDDDEAERMKEEYRQWRYKSEYWDAAGYMYKVELLKSKRIKMYDANTGQLIRVIHPDTPIWPLSPFVVGLIGLASMAALGVLNKEFFDQFKQSR
ncbi:MAG: hypothetical protein LBT22_02820 [Peptococcaceae bacterium]|nr:hypothetical protein [Peptococcaceae bacterium]